CSVFSLAADTDHVLLRSPGAGALEAVARALAGDRAGDRAHEIVVGAAVAQHVAQGDRVVVAEARVQRADGGEPEPVAVAAEVLRHGRDDADLAQRTAATRAVTDNGPVARRAGVAAGAARARIGTTRDEGAEIALEGAADLRRG